MYLKNNFIYNFASSVSIFFVLLYVFNTQFESFIYFYDILLVLIGYKCAKDYYNSKSFFEFYKQKFDEIAPPLISVVFLSLIIVFFVFLQLDTSNYIKSSIYSLFFVSNFFYWLNVHEFSQLYISVHPLINTWITSLIFQFYIYFPIIIFFNNLKFFNRFSNSFIISIIIIGFILKILFFGRDQSMYLLPHRIGELLLGSLIYYLSDNKLSNKYSYSFLIIFVLILIYCIFNFSFASYPGISSVFFIINFAAIIYFFPKLKKIKNLDNFWNNCAKLNLFVLLLGPLIINFYSYYTVIDNNIFENIFLIIFIYIFSFLMHKIFYYKFNLSKKIIIYLSTLIILILVNFNLNNIYNSKIFLNKSVLKLLDIFNEQNKGKLIFEHEMFNYKRLENFYNKEVVIIFGDSLGHDIYIGFKQLETPYEYVFIDNSTGCSEIMSKTIHFSEKIANFLFKKESQYKVLFNYCKSRYHNIDKLIQNNDIKNVIVVMNWEKSEIKNIDYILNYFLSKNIQPMILEKRINFPHFRKSIKKFMGNQIKVDNFLISNFKHFDELNLLLSNKLKLYNLELIRFNEFLCEKKIKCKLKKDNIYLFSDHSHLSLLGSKLAVDRFYKKFF